MLERVLIANRGAIAVRIIRTLKTMGVQAIGVYAEADRHSLHVRLADQAWSLGEGNVRDTYLNQDKLLQIATQSGAEAVHPGYGFLSENADFVSRCEQAGLVFLGPTVEQMAAFGLKHRARELARQNAVPLLPGSGLLTSLEEARSAAEHIGYPVMLKSTAGGGGIGMQRCDSPPQLHEAFNRVKRLAGHNFADDGVFLEKFIARARHIEVQVFGDGKGGVLALGERDCSAQRRNQKVIEETPAPGLSDEVRTALQATAIRLCEAVSYRSAGTVEYVYDDQSGQFFFLEVNTRLQVEHGVTELVYGVDIVRWMVQLASGELPPLATLKTSPGGHAIQVRVYAEDPARQFQPGAGLLSHVQFPDTVSQGQLRIDSWLDSGGVEVSAYYDPLLAKVIVHADSRSQALAALAEALEGCQLYGIETNLSWLRHLLTLADVREGRVITATLGSVPWSPATLDILNGGTLTTVQDVPGRTGYWHVGVPPSGPFDSRSFRHGNRLLGNAEEAAGLEITLRGPTVRFNHDCAFVLTGAIIRACLDDETLSHGEVINASAGQILTLSEVQGAGCRSYLLLAGGIDCPLYLGSRSTFTLGKFGGHTGRQLRTGDVLHLTQPEHRPLARLPAGLRPVWQNEWQLRVIYGPHGAPDFFTEADINTFFDASWQVHYNSSRTGIRLIGPKPKWARSDGGEAGMHPSNIHDNAYAFGTVDFTGDMPVILGPDGPSLGGFVCPATVITADLWQLGQLKAGDRVRFVPVSLDEADRLATWQCQIARDQLPLPEKPVDLCRDNPVLIAWPATDRQPSLTIRAAGDRFLLLEYGDAQLDIALRFRVHALMQWLDAHPQAGRLELTPGIRSLQVHFNSLILPRQTLLNTLLQADHELGSLENATVPSRTVWLPLSWDDEACQQAVTRYMQSVRPDAPWCPGNIEFIRRINGLSSVDEVKDMVFSARYLVMGLGDVYLGAPVATPLDPRHRLVTTKYNPARTWTAENSVGIGGAYLCVYGMEGPGGYQFVGRTLQMWNRDRQTDAFRLPWLLRFFDQIRFYPVSAEELVSIRERFPWGDYPLHCEEGEFSLAAYQQKLADCHQQIAAFQQRRQQAFDEELARWWRDGQLTFDSSLVEEETESESIPDGCYGVESQIAGSVWEWRVKPGDRVRAGETLGILESMKMEIPILATVNGIILTVQRAAGQQVQSGQLLLVLAAAEN